MLIDGGYGVIKAIKKPLSLQGLWGEYTKEEDSQGQAFIYVDP